MTMQEMANYLRNNRNSFPEYSDAEIEYVLERWAYESVYPEAVVDILFATEPVADVELFRIVWIDPFMDCPDTEEWLDHKRMQNRHVMHRECKSRMYAERQARKAKKGAIANG